MGHARSLHYPGSQAVDLYLLPEIHKALNLGVLVILQAVEDLFNFIHELLPIGLALIWVDLILALSEV